MYDKYNDVYRFVKHLMVQSAGLCANTDQVVMTGSHQLDIPEVMLEELNFSIQSRQSR